MFVKAYRYHVQPEKTEQYLAIQERANQVYQKHICYRAVHLRSREDPSLWLEIHWYPNEETYNKGMDLVNAEPEISQLWQEFQATLDTSRQTIIEEYFEQIRSDDNIIACCKD
jgi:hypothetical protein